MPLYFLLTAINVEDRKSNEDSILGIQHEELFSSLEDEEYN